jgi:hypothetical protein
MAIAPLQLPGQFQSPSVDLAGSLSQLGQIYKQSQNDAKLSDLGKKLASGTMDYRAAAGQTADMGDIHSTLKFLALDEQKKKQDLGKASAADFAKGLSGLYGGQPSASETIADPPNVSVSTPSIAPPNPAVLSPVGPPMSLATRAPIAPTAKVWGDQEAVNAGIYEPPTRIADNLPAPAAAPAKSFEVGAEHVPVLLKAMADPNLPEHQRDTAKVLLTEAFKNMKEPEKIQTLRALKADPSLLGVEQKLRAAGKTEINIDQKGETAFATAAGGALGKRFEKLSEEGQTATQDLALVGQLRDLGQVVKTGAPAAVQGWLAERGIKVGDNVGAVEAYGSIIDKLTPQQRVPGSGSTSDYEGRMFKNSLPKLINTPEGNVIIESTLAGLAQYKLDRAAIAEKALSGELDRGTALKQMREMPNPYANFKEFAKTGFKADPSNPASATAATKFSAPEIDQSLAAARQALARNPGARDGIIKKLRDNGIDPSGL